MHTLLPSLTPQAGGTLHLICQVGDSTKSINEPPVASPSWYSALYRGGSLCNLVKSRCRDRAGTHPSPSSTNRSDRRH